MAVIRKNVSVFSLQCDMAGIWKLTMARRGGTKLCNIAILVGLRLLKMV